MGVIKRQGIKNLFITYFGVIIGAISTLYIQPELLSIDELGFTRNLYNFSFLLSLFIPLGLPRNVQGLHLRIYFNLFFYCQCIYRFSFFYFQKLYTTLIHD